MMDQNCIIRYYIIIGLGATEVKAFFKYLMPIELFFQADPRLIERQNLVENRGLASGL